MTRQQMIKMFTDRIEELEKRVGGNNDLRIKNINLNKLLLSVLTGPRLDQHFYQ